MLEALGAAHDAVEAVLLLVSGGEDGTLAPEEVDVAGEAEEGVLFSEHEFETKSFEGFSVIGAGEGPGVALGGEERGAGSVEGAEGTGEGGVVLDFGDLCDVVGIGPEIEEA